MYNQTRQEMEHLKRRHAQLAQEMSVLAGQLKALETRLDAPGQTVADPKLASPITAAAETKIEIPKSRPPVPPPIPPIIRRQDPPATVVIEKSSVKPAVEPIPNLSAQPVGELKFAKCQCQHCGGHLEFTTALVGSTLPCPHCGQVTSLAMEIEPRVETPPLPPRIVEPPSPVAMPASRESQPEKERSFEMRLGRHWIPRLGIGMVLTAFVLFGNYAYQNYIGRIGPAAKVSLLYLAGGILLGAGAWWQRKAARESLRNYAQVLFAGGLATVYFTTYAGHHIEQLRVIGSPLLDGALLLAWAGFMVWIADRKKSEVLALFAVGLAYYTSVITRVGSFTLYSNLVLTLAAVVFLVRNRWATLSFASLVATYVSYGFWRFFDGSGWQWATPDQGLWFGVFFLGSYWTIFTAAVFLSKHEKFAGSNRATFLTLNNGEFFVMFLLTMLQVRTGGFWKFSLGYGFALLALAELARRLLASEPLAKNSYLMQGLLLITVGLISKFSGLQLALLLGAESVVLMTLGTARKSLILKIGSYLTGALAVGWGIDSLQRNDPRGLYLNAGLGALMAFQAWWSHRQTAAEKEPLLRPVPAFFTLLALISWLAATWYNTSPENFPLALAFEALALTLSVYALGVREIALLGQGLLLIAQIAWLFHFMQPETPPPWWNPALMIGVTLSLSHWWQRQTVLAAGRQVQVFWQGVCALALAGVLYFWLSPLVSARSWLGLTSLLAVGITAYGVFTRAWFLAACGQIFLVVSAGQFALQLLGTKPEWFIPLAPIAALVFLSTATVKWFQSPVRAGEKVREPLLQLALLYRWVALAMSLWWVVEYIPERERIWVTALLGSLVFGWAGWRRNAEALLWSAAFSLFGLGLFLAPPHESSTLYPPNLLAILALLGQQRIAKNLPGRYPLDRRVLGAMIFLGGLGVWLFLTRWVRQSASGFYLTASWSAVALVFFAGGMALRERVYRWLGLGVLACALGRVFIFDIWKLGTPYRILSFMALGLVLLVLGFIYNKYQEKIKEWL